MDNRTKEEFDGQMHARVKAWNSAFDLVNPIIEEHGLVPYPIGGNIFVTGTTSTEVDQHVDQVINVANWLLEPLT